MLTAKLTAAYNEKLWLTMLDRIKMLQFQIMLIIMMIIIVY